MQHRYDLLSQGALITSPKCPLCGKEGEGVAQVEAHRAAKLRQCACASPIALVHTLPNDALNHGQVLHKEGISSADHLGFVSDSVSR